MFPVWQTVHHTKTCANSLARAWITAVVLLLLAVSGQAAVEDGDRKALVIGIDTYENIESLKRAVGDARAMAHTFRQLGFKVTSVHNTDRLALNVALADFVSSLKKGDLAVIHYSGHGIEIDGENYLLPSDIPKPRSGREQLVKYEAIGLRRLITQVTEAGARSRVFIIDACRNNPFANTGLRSVGSTRGLARVEAPAGTFVMYSAGYRQMALDRLDEHDTAPTSVYTRVLTEELLVPGRGIAQTARVVRRKVARLAQRVGHVQRPAYYDELTASLVLKAPDVAKVEKKPTVDDLGLPTQPDREVELVFWDTVKDSRDKRLFEAYLQRYPNGLFAGLARKIIASLEVGAVLPPPESKAKVAAVDPVALPDASEATPVPETALDRLTMVKEIQRSLVRLGCDPGGADGKWGRRSARALAAYNRHAASKLASLEPSMDVMRALENQKLRVCPLNCGVRYREDGGRCVLKACPRGDVLDRSGNCVARKKPDTKKKQQARRTPDAERRKRDDARRRDAKRKRDDLRKQRDAKRKRDDARKRRDAERRKKAEKRITRKKNQSGGGKKCGWCESRFGTVMICGHAYTSMKSAGRCR